uniref:Glycerophosphodiester phosphodiesterase domain containing 3a n=1 Tax=Hucho hucho TaxID=62062 RepID=A0A4W5PED3_9TELE
MSLHVFGILPQGSSSVYFIKVWEYVKQDFSLIANAGLSDRLHLIYWLVTEELIMASYLYFILPALGGYTLTSLYLLKNPQILHKKKRAAFHCTHISHRGGKEGTVEGCSSYLQGTGMLELDCHLTLDGHVVVSHDENLLRQTGHDVTISSLNLEELPLYKDRLEVTFNAGRYSTGTDRKFTLLEDVFRKFPKMPVNIEIKEDNGLLMEKASNMVKQYDREDLTVWATEDSTIMKKCRRTNSTMPYSFSMRRGLQLLLLYYSGLLPFVPLGESFLQFYLPRIINRTYIPEERLLKNRMVIYLIEKWVHLLQQQSSSLSQLKPTDHIQALIKD